jgi:hypothetical protein
MKTAVTPCGLAHTDGLKKHRHCCESLKSRIHTYIHTHTGRYGHTEREGKENKEKLEGKIKSKVKRKKGARQKKENIIKESKEPKGKAL